MNSIQSPKLVHKKTIVYNINVGGATATHQNAQIASGSLRPNFVTTAGGKTAFQKKTNGIQAAVLAACVIVSPTVSQARITQYSSVPTPTTRQEPRESSAELSRYLQAICSSGDVTEDTVLQTRELYLALQQVMNGNLPTPDAASGPNGEILLAWDKDEHHLELEIIPGTAAELFYRNRVTGHLWGEEYEIEKPISNSAKEMLAFFIP